MELVAQSRWVTLGFKQKDKISHLFSYVLQMALGHCRAGIGGMSVGKARKYCANNKSGNVKVKKSGAPVTRSKKPKRGVAKAYVRASKLKTQSRTTNSGGTHTRFT